MSQHPPYFSPLQQQVLKAMAIPLWRQRELPVAAVAPLTVIGGDAALRQSRFYTAMLQLLALDPATIAEATTPPDTGRCWLLASDCPLPRLEGEWLITPPLAQLQQVQHKRRLWQLVQQWL